MRCATDLAKGVQWQPGAAPKAACVMQAVLLSAALAVLGQSLVNLFVDISSITLQIAIFWVILPFVWIGWERIPGLSRPAEGLPCVSFTADVIATDDGHGRGRALRVVEIARYWGALVISLVPSDADATRPCSQARKTMRITVWQSAIGKDNFRKISALALWHARRGA